MRGTQHSEMSTARQMSQTRQTPNQSQRMEDIRIFEEWLRESNRSFTWSRRLHQGALSGCVMDIRDLLLRAGFLILMFWYFGWNTWKALFFYFGTECKVA